MQMLVCSCVRTWVGACVRVCVCACVRVCVCACVYRVLASLRVGAWVRAPYAYMCERVQIRVRSCVDAVLITRSLFNASIISVRATWLDGTLDQRLALFTHSTTRSCGQSRHPQEKPRLPSERNSLPGCQYYQAPLGKLIMESERNTYLPTNILTIKNRSIGPTHFDTQYLVFCHVLPSHSLHLSATHVMRWTFLYVLLCFHVGFVIGFQLRLMA